MDDGGSVMGILDDLLEEMRIAVANAQRVRAQIIHAQESVAPPPVTREVKAWELRPGMVGWDGRATVLEVAIQYSDRRPATVTSAWSDDQVRTDQAVCMFTILA